jgi:hypothetical protein
MRNSSCRGSVSCGHGFGEGGRTHLDVIDLAVLNSLVLVEAEQALLGTAVEELEVLGVTHDDENVNG